MTEMRLFQFPWLRGPGKSSDENFEILALELLKAHYPEGGHFRVGAPDGGIDILGEESVVNHWGRIVGKVKVAYQCKAYSAFRSDLVHAVSQSLESALKTRSTESSLSWEKYTLIVPLLLSKKQRMRIEHAWTSKGLEASILDIDSIESLLYAFEDVRTRFFPDFGFIIPRENKPIQVGFPDTSDTVEISIFLHRFQAAVDFTVPLDLTVAGFLEILVQELSLPIMSKYHDWSTRFFRMDWNLVPSDQPESPFDRTQSFRQLGIRDQTQFELHSSEILISATMYASIPKDEPNEIFDKNGWHSNPAIPFTQFIDECMDSRLRRLLPVSEDEERT
jgi:hypothetical protein